MTGVGGATAVSQSGKVTSGTGAGAVSTGGLEIDEGDAAGADGMDVTGAGLAGACGVGPVNQSGKVTSGNPAVTIFVGGWATAGVGGIGVGVGGKGAGVAAAG